MIQDPSAVRHSEVLLVIRVVGRLWICFGGRSLGNKVVGKLVTFTLVACILLRKTSASSLGGRCSFQRLDTLNIIQSPIKDKNFFDCFVLKYFKDFRPCLS